LKAPSSLNLLKVGIIFRSAAAVKRSTGDFGPGGVGGDEPGVENGAQAEAAIAAAAHPFPRRHDLYEDLLSGADVEIRKLIRIWDAITVHADRIVSGRHVAIKGRVRLGNPDKLSVQPEVGGLMALVRPLVAIEPDPGFAGRNGWNRHRTRRWDLAAACQDQDQAHGQPIEAMPEDGGVRERGSPHPVVLLGLPRADSYSHPSCSIKDQTTISTAVAPPARLGEAQKAIATEDPVP
jgi:hypothetical protein